jgi:GTPase SAR1 family protein
VISPISSSGFKNKTIELEGKRVKLQIWVSCRLDGNFSTRHVYSRSISFLFFFALACFQDLAGTERFSSIMHNYYRASQGVLLVYDSTDPSTLAELQSRFVPGILEHGRKDVSMVLVATMCDDVQQRAVDPSEGQAMANQLGKMMT